MTDDVSLTIGQFARLCRLSIKQLRHYDDLGLLVPHHVDDETGYRYYRHDQAPGAVTIAMLRSLGASLPEIARIITGDEGDATLRAIRDRLDSEARRRQLMAAAVDRILATGLPQVDVSVVRQEPVRLVTVRDVAPVERIGEVTSAAVARLLGALAAAEQAPTYPMIGLFPLDFHDDVAITVGVGCPADVTGTEVVHLRGGTFAVATHVGPYDQIAVTAHGLLAWCGRRGHVPSGPIREAYLADPHTTPPQQLVTQLMIELEESP